MKPYIENVGNLQKIALVVEGSDAHWTESLSPSELQQPLEVQLLPE